MVERYTHVREAAAREAFAYLVGHAALQRDWRCVAGAHGEVRDVRWYDAAGQQPYAFIPNRSDLLWYFRRPALVSGRWNRGLLAESFQDVRENSRGELTVRIRALDDARRLVALVFGE